MTNTPVTAEPEGKPQPNAVLPNGLPGLQVKCPHCGCEYAIQWPGEDHKGEILVECHCEGLYMVESPHGPAPIDVAQLEDTTGRNGQGLLVDEEGVPLPPEQQTVPKRAHDRARAVDRANIPTVVPPGAQPHGAVAVPQPTPDTAEPEAPAAPAEG